MALVFPIKLSDEEKLETLQRLDQFRQWYSLERKALLPCLWQYHHWAEIQVIGGTCGNGPRRIICLMEHGNSMPIDWVQPTDEVHRHLDVLKK
jgi:hypothetical protein